MTALSFRAEVQGMLRERLLDAAYEMLEASGWSSVTMSKLATTVGVSRQTVHTELGTRHKLANLIDNDVSLHSCLSFWRQRAFFEALRSRIAATMPGRRLSYRHLEVAVTNSSS